MQAGRWIKFGLIAVAPPVIYFLTYLIALAGWSADASGVSLVALYGIQIFAFLTQPWANLCGVGHEKLAVLIAIVQYGLIGITIAFFWYRRACARARAQGNLYLNCHCDRTGVAGDAVCPECGTGSGTA